MRPEVSSTMRELAGRSLTGTYLYSYSVKPGISTTSACARIVELASGQSLNIILNR